MSFNKTILAGSALLGCALMPAYLNAASVVEHITVSGSRLATPASKLAVSRTVLDEQMIQASGAIQLTDLLRGMPGVSIAQSGSPGALTEIRLRGSESNHLLVLIDGVAVNDIGQGSLLDLAHITTANIARVELLRGPQSALWGSGAIGGVLSITTRTAAQRGSSSLSAHAGAGSRGTFKAGINAGAVLDDLTIRGYVEHVGTDGDNVSRLGDEQDGYQNFTTGASLGYSLSTSHQLDWTLRATQYENDYDTIDTVNTGLPTDAANVTQGDQLTSQLRWTYSLPHSDYVSSLSWHFHEDSNDNRVAGNDAGGTTGTRHQLTWLHRTSLSQNWSVAAGLDFLRREFEQRGPVVFGDPNQSQHDTTTAIFTELAGDLSADLHSALSLRFDNNSEFDDAISYRAGVTWDISSSLSVFVSHGRAVKTPTFTERFGYFPGSFVGNNALEVETSQEWELGLRGRYSMTEMSLSVFDTQLDNEIMGYVFIPELGAATAQNAQAESQRRGLEASMEVNLEHATVRASYSYLDASEEANGDSVTELRRARHSGAVSLFSDLNTSSLTVYAKIAYTGSRDDRFFPPYPQLPVRAHLRPYTLASVNLSYTLAADWQLALRVDNAFDTEYEDIVGYPGERRRALLTLTYQH